MRGEQNRIDFLETQIELTPRLGFDLYALHYIGGLDEPSPDQNFAGGLPNVCFILVNYTYKKIRFMWQAKGQNIGKLTRDCVLF
jgi:hypothetical protein